MIYQRFTATFVLLLTLFEIGGTPRRASALGTVFTYQGRLMDGTTLANGLYDLRAQLNNAVVGGNQVGNTVTLDEVVVTNGLFTVEIDFGANIFNGNSFWLELSVRPGVDTGSYTVLSPRQAITATPYAIYASVAATAEVAKNLGATATVPWSALTGLPPGFADGVDNDTIYSAGSGLKLIGTSLSIAPAGVVTSMLAVGAVAADNLQDGSVTSSKLAATAITVDKIPAGQLVKSVNALRDDVLFVGTNNVAIDVAANVIQISAFDLWKATGNNGTTPANFLGTLDDQPLEFRVNNSRALRLEPNANAPNLIGGASGNFVAQGIFGAVISGGGGGNGANRVTDEYGTIAGGLGNQAGNNDGNIFVGRYATVSGGYLNRASGEASTVGGGSSCLAEGEFATVSGGANNLAIGYAGVVAGGGGYSSSLDRTIPNKALGFWSAIGGGGDNTVTNEFGVVAGGSNNRSGGIFGTIGGGKDNSTMAAYATVPGGHLNSAQGTTSFAAGNRAIAEHDGAFVWADGTANSDFRSVAPDEFAVRATGGARFVSGLDASGNPASGVQLPAGGGAWATLSDRASKENLAPVNNRALLERLAAIPVQTWNYKTQNPAIRHIGIIAQDFANAFQVGEDDKHISTVDADGVALAAIKGLYELVREKAAEMRAKESEIQDLNERLRALEKTVSALTNKKQAAKNETD
ncbi:MAG: tail fiber domain-containing protein [Verrucomicrobiota bacterium]